MWNNLSVKTKYYTECRYKGEAFVVVCLQTLIIHEQIYLIYQIDPDSLHVLSHQVVRVMFEFPTRESKNENRIIVNIPYPCS